MWPYFAVLLLASLLAYCSPWWDARKRDFAGQSKLIDSARQLPNGFDWMLVAVLTTFAGARFGVGTDYFPYWSLYSHLDTARWGQSIAASPQEVGYTVLSLLVKTVSTSPHAIFWVTSAITVTLAILTYKSWHTDFAMVVFLYIALAAYLAPLNVLRQGIAVSLVLLADRVFGRSRIAFVALVALAATVHVSAVVFGAVYLLTRNVKPTARGTLISAGVMMLAAPIAFRSGIVLKGANILSSRYGDYLQQDPVGVGTYLGILFRLAMALYVIYLARGSAQGSHHRTLMVIAVLFSIAGTEFKVVSRMDLYFGIFTPLAAGQALAERPREPVHRVLFLLGGVGYMAMYLLNYGGLVPYETYAAS